MDIKSIEAEPTNAERSAIDALLGSPRSAWDGGPRGNPRDAHVATVGGRESRAQRHLLLPALRALQARIGWISEGGLGYVCDRLNVPPADAWGVATFYALLSTEPLPERVVHVCDDIACKIRGADQLIAELGTPGSDLFFRSNDPDRKKRSDPGICKRSPCLGKCEQAPVAYVATAGEHPQEALLGHVTADDVRTLLKGGEASVPDGEITLRQDRASLRLLRRVGRVDPTSLEAYRVDGGFAALEKARAIGAEAVIAEVTASRLMGRGGAAFPTGRKWEAVRTQPARPHYLICNADESEPGT